MVLTTAAAGLVTTALPASAVDRPATRTICVGVTPHSWGDRPGLPDAEVRCFEIEQPGGAPPAPESASYLVVFRSVAAIDPTRSVTLRNAMADGMLKKLCDPRNPVPRSETCGEKSSRPWGMLKQFSTAAELLDGAPIEVGYVGHLARPGSAKEIDWLRTITAGLADGVSLYAYALVVPVNAASYRALALDRFDAVDALLTDVFKTG